MFTSHVQSKPKIKATRFSPRGAESFSIAATDSGFEINVTGHEGSRRIPVAWTEVKRIESYKKNQYIQNCACLVLALKDGSAVELNEHITGWSALIAALPTSLPGCIGAEEWWSPSSPDLNWRTIYYRYSISGLGSKAASA